MLIGIFLFIMSFASKNTTLQPRGLFIYFYKSINSNSEKCK